MSALQESKIDKLAELYINIILNINTHQGVANLQTVLTLANQPEPSNPVWEGWRTGAQKVLTSKTLIELRQRCLDELAGLYPPLDENVTYLIIHRLELLRPIMDRLDILYTNFSTHLGPKAQLLQELTERTVQASKAWTEHTAKTSLGDPIYVRLIGPYLNEDEKPLSILAFERYLSDFNPEETFNLDTLSWSLEPGSPLITGKNAQRLAPIFERGRAWSDLRRYLLI